MEQHGSTDPLPLTDPASARWRPTPEPPALDLSGLPRLDPERLALARPTPGLLTYAQLVEEAGGRAGARRLLAEGLWWRVVRGAYAPIEVPDDTVARAAALRMVLPPDVAASHRTALWSLGLDVLGATLDVTVPRGRHLRNRPGLTTWCADLGEAELVRVEGARAVSAARAFVDVARTEQLVEAVAVGDLVLRSGAATMEQFEVALCRAAGLRGIIGARAVLPYLEPRSESVMESRLRMRLILGGCLGRTRSGTSIRIKDTSDAWICIFVVWCSSTTAGPADSTRSPSSLSGAGRPAWPRPGSRCGGSRRRTTTGGRRSRCVPR